MKSIHRKVVGYFATRTGTMYILCDGDACLIAGSEKSLNRYIIKLAGDNPADYHIKKTRFGEIIQGMQLGGVYTFDKKAYNKFLPLAKAEGLNMVDFQIEDDPKPQKNAVCLMRVKWTDIS